MQIEARLRQLRKYHPYWEALCIPPLLITHRLCYDLMGTILSRGETNYSYLLTTPLDHKIPFIPFFVLPYILTWVYGFFIFIYAVGCGTYKKQTFRYFYLSFFALTCLECLLWYSFPASIATLRVPLDLLSGCGWLGELTRYVYDNATPWNVNPSAHIAFAFSAWLFSKHYAPQGQRWLFLLLFILIGLSTIFIKNHYLADILGGMALSSFVYLLIFLPASKRALLDGLRSRTVVGFSYLVCALAALVYFNLTGALWN